MKNMYKSKYTVQAKFLKAMTVIAAVLGAGVYFAGVPYAGRMILDYAPEFSNRYLPWLLLIWLTAVPVAAVFVMCFKLAVAIENGEAFSYESESCLKGVALMAAADSAIFFIGNVIYFLLGINHPSVFIASLSICFVGVCIYVVCSTLSQLVGEAVRIRTENESYI